jgi:DNA-binding CsgD family transcriptional regulator
MPLVGRDVELRALAAWLDDAGAGRGRAVLVGGEAGIGKSRLLAAFAEVAEGAGATVAWGRTTELDGAPPYWPWLRVLDRLEGRAALEATAGVDPEAERFARFEAVVAHLGEAARSRPLVVVLEDVHRADPSSLRLLSHVAGRVDGAAVLLLASHRATAALDEVARHPATRRLELAGLDAGAVGTLLPGAGGDVVARVHAVSGGNPLLVAELVRHLAGGGALATVPRTVRDGVGARLDRLSPWCAEVVRTGAVIGRTFAAGLVATATGRPAIACLEAIDEAVGAGLVEPTGRPGEFRFVHALVRDAAEATLSAAQLPAAHRAIAEAIEAYEGTGDAHVADLARHWDAASALGERERAAAWCQRAAAVADRQLAWEDAARLFDRALDLGGDTAAPLDRFARAFGAARARLHCDEVTTAVEYSVAAAAAARDAGRPDLFAEALLVSEGRSVVPGPMTDLAREALDLLPPEDHARRARVHSHLANISYYVDPSAMAGHSEQATAEAAQAGDPLADLAAIRARHQLLHGPQHAEERLELAARLGDAARQPPRPSVAFWEPLWRIDSLLELGRVADAVATMPLLRQRLDAAGSPMAGWHRARVEAALAQATGRFAEGLQHAETVRRLFAALESPMGAEQMHLGYCTGLARHAGWSAELADRWRAVESDWFPPFIGELPLIGPGLAHAGAGRLDEARAYYARLSPVVSSEPPAALLLQSHALRLYLASLLGVIDDLPPLLAALEPYRGRHVASGGGILTYDGPVELWLGIGAGALGRLEDADRDLAAAADIARRSGTPAFAVHAGVERAFVLTARGDAGGARALLAQARPEAQRLGMPDFLARIDDALAPPQNDAGPLSPREMEVAALVAAGRTNREIAAELYLSERTAQNHVQHILTKLGLENRTQVATWYHSRNGAP